MTEYAPLTASQIELAKKIEKAPLELTERERTKAGGIGHDLQFLQVTGFVKGENVFVAQDNMDSVNRYSRTTKPIP